MSELVLNMSRAIQVSWQSTCVRRKVGAVLLDPYGVVQAEGFNEERDEADCFKSCPRAALSYEALVGGSDYHNGVGICISLHAEMMALDLAEDRYEAVEDQFLGWTMVVTCEPCGDCRKVLNERGVYVVFGETL